MLLLIINLSVSMISFAQVYTAQWFNTIPHQNVQLLVGIHLTWFCFNSKVIIDAIGYCISAVRIIYRYNCLLDSYHMDMTCTLDSPHIMVSLALTAWLWEALQIQNGIYGCTVDEMRKTIWICTYDQYASLSMISIALNNSQPLKLIIECVNFFLSCTWK